ncbi:hypothetical protein M430DRAFT_132978 [Amorphotheca resinae ATCC 22711]|uniref:Zn(2)-C6 fungal-type domain-containing protein n=1 Tax=Amorphotheca resinae ATCC 22711 TaxID=857342 RepID=A0A2T3BGL5_AMORE|nr:hypothetical protein M430DRAFT_132978 [Amorphotheca resinae ATCC 22711]PSS28468.1 hypothetical protein M430DRAFT_132978 [Amorphotheca resinae ATCC 22711]
MRASTVHRAPSKRGRTGCLTCRQRHLKCDEEKPRCGRCRRTSRECVPDDLVTFRSGQRVAARAQLRSGSLEVSGESLGSAEHVDVFPKEHQWVETPGTLSFINETSEMMAEYGRPQMQNDNTNGSNTSSALPEQTPSPTSTAAQGLLHFRHPSNASQDPQDFQNGASHVRLSLTPPQSSHSDSSYLPFITSPISTSNSNPQTVPIHIRDLLQADDQANDTFDPILSNVPLKLYGERMQLPFKVPHEALLFQHYMEHLAPLLDITDIQRHFGVDVPERAMSCPVLLNALLAFSARHLSRTSDYDPAIADYYHQKCVRLMIPMLDQKELVADETLFAAAVILRAFEETDESNMGGGPEPHLTGTSVFANAQLEFGTWGGLGHAAFWVFVRQDIYMSLLSQRPLKVDLKGWEDRLSFNLGFEPTSDCTWANRMIWIVAEIVAFCFGDKNGSNWEAPRMKTERWNLCRPKSFDPILYHPRDEKCGRLFPEIRLGHPWHVTGMQYYYIAKLFLAVYNPSIPKIGLGYQRQRRAIAEEVLQNAEAVCGIAFSSSLVAARLTACVAIIACGPWFIERDREQQEMLLQLLRRAEVENAWPTSFLTQGLMGEWAWE